MPASTAATQQTTAISTSVTPCWRATGRSVRRFVFIAFPFRVRCGHCRKRRRAALPPRGGGAEGSTGAPWRGPQPGDTRSDVADELAELVHVFETAVHGGE